MEPLLTKAEVSVVSVSAVVISISVKTVLVNAAPSLSLEVASGPVSTHVLM